MIDDSGVGRCWQIHSMESVGKTSSFLFGSDWNDYWYVIGSWDDLGYGCFGVCDLTLTNPYIFYKKELLFTTCVYFPKRFAIVIDIWNDFWIWLNMLNYSLFALLNPLFFSLFTHEMCINRLCRRA